MPPINFAEVNEIIQSLGDGVPPLKPASATINVIAKALEKVQENKQQCLYLFKRSAGLWKELNELAQGRSDTETMRNLGEFLRALGLVQDVVVQLGTEKRLRRFLQRHEAAGRIQAAHQALDNCVELFQVKNIGAIAFSLEDQRAAEQVDQADLLAALEGVKQNGEDILKALDIQKDQTMDAIRGLQNALAGDIEDQLQKRFAQLSLELLAKTQPANVVIAYDWAISELEIKLDGAIVGAGGFGQVLIGSWRSAKIAVKKIQKETPKDMLVREIEIWQKLQYPHIATFYKACIDSNPPFLIAEFYKFGNIAVYLRDHPAANRAELCRQIALGMDFLHSKKVIHADLKAANVLIDDGHKARICDFGLSQIKAFQSAQTVIDAPVVPARGVSGTKVYMAPERLRRGSLTAATDMYAFAMTIYEIYVAVVPFRDLPPDLLFQNVINGERPERPQDAIVAQRGLTDMIWKLVESAWDQDPKKRPTFPTAANALEVAAGVYSQLPTSAIPPPAAPSSPSEETARFVQLPVGISAVAAEEHVQQNIQQAVTYYATTVASAASTLGMSSTQTVYSTLASAHDPPPPTYMSFAASTGPSSTLSSTFSVQQDPVSMDIDTPIPSSVYYPPRTEHAMEIDQQMPATVQAQRPAPAAPRPRPQVQAAQPQVAEEFPCGVWNLVNFKSENIAHLPDGNSSSDVVGSIIENKPGEKWRVTKAARDRYFLQNEHFGTYAGAKDNFVVGKDIGKEQWIIKRARTVGVYTISPVSNDNLNWALPDDEIGTPIALRSGPTNPKHQWRFVSG